MLLTRMRSVTDVVPVLVLPLNVQTQCCSWLNDGMLPFLSTSTRYSSVKRAMTGVQQAEKLR